MYGSGRDRKALLEGFEDGGDAVGESYDGGANCVKTSVDIIDEGLEDLNLVASGCEGLDNAGRCVLVEVGHVESDRSWPYLSTVPAVQPDMRRCFRTGRNSPLRRS